MMRVGTDPNFVPRPGAASSAHETSTGMRTIDRRAIGRFVIEAKPATASSRAQQ